MKINETLRERLIAHGWTIDTNYSAHKFYQNCAGGRDAVIYISPTMLTAEYTSEGRNALSTCYAFHADGAAYVDEFIADMERRIDATYGRRIMVMLAQPA